MHLKKTWYYSFESYKQQILDTDSKGLKGRQIQV